MNKGMSVVIITYNAAGRLKECLESVRWANEIILVDSGSSDNTVDIAKEYTDKIFTRGFDNFSLQKNFAIEKAGCGWVLSIDSDEVITQELTDELRAVMKNTKFDGFYIERLNYIYGKFLNYARPDYQLRFFRKESGRFKQPVHERLNINGNRISYLKGKILHYTMEDVSHHINKLDQFTDYDVNYYPVKSIDFFWIIRKLVIRPILKFIQHYIFKKGYKDGMLGFIFCINTVMGEFLTHAKYCERILGSKR